MLRNFQDDATFYASLPKKRVGACALLFYRHDLLIVQPTYAAGWILPGGTVQGEESPLEGLRRECQEELNLKVEPTQLISIDYISNRDVKGEYFQFLFACKNLTENQVLKIKLEPYELRDFRFVGIPQALDLLTPAVAKRVHSSLDIDKKYFCSKYLENGLTRL